MMIHLFLDLDGTLIDSCEGIYYSFKKTCSLMSIKFPELNCFRQKIGPPIADIFSYFNPDAQLLEIDNFQKIFRTIYNEEGCKMSKCYDGVELQLLSLSKRHDLSLSVITNKPTEPALSILKILSIFPLFKLVIGSDYLHYHRIGEPFQNKSLAIEYAMKKLSADKSTTIYVGDTIFDFKSAQIVGIPFVAATYGYHEWKDSELVGKISIAKPDNLFSVIANLSD